MWDPRPFWNFKFLKEPAEVFLSRGKPRTSDGGFGAIHQTGTIPVPWFRNPNQVPKESFRNAWCMVEPCYSKCGPQPRPHPGAYGKCSISGPSPDPRAEPVSSPQPRGIHRHNKGRGALCRARMCLSAVSLLPYWYRNSAGSPALGHLNLLLGRAVGF